MRKKRFLIGTDSFKEIRGDESYYVDKSLLIESVIHSSKVTLIPRPRRFGKTLGMTMLRFFFEQNEPENLKLFEGLAIAKDSECMEHFGKYPTIYMSLKDIKAPDWDCAKGMLLDEISTLVRDQYSVLEGKVNKETQTKLDSLMAREASWEDVLNTLKILMTALYEVTGQPAVLLIDEYDTPIIEARANGYQREMLDFMKVWLGVALKPKRQEVLFRAVLTGILRIAKESLFSGLNNLQVRDMLNSGDFSDKFGFTEAEVQGVLKDFEVTDKSKEIKRWYNGYKINGITIYNPWSVTNYVFNLPSSPSPHWLNTSQNSLVHEELAKGNLRLKEDLEVLLKGGDLRYSINPHVNLDQVGDSTENIWSFLYYCGYLKAEDPQPNPIDPEVTEYLLSIPNVEISKAYSSFVQQHFLDIKWSDETELFLQCFTQPETHLKHLEGTLQKLVLSLMSFHDTAKQPEAVFHAFCLGLLANLRNVFKIRSNAEVGYGRADITMKPTSQIVPAGFVIEFKALSKKEKLENGLDRALKQIAEKAYASEMEQAGVKPVYKIAMVLKGKKLKLKIV